MSTDLVLDFESDWDWFYETEPSDDPDECRTIRSTTLRQYLTDLEYLADIELRMTAVEDLARLNDRHSDLLDRFRDLQHDVAVLERAREQLLASFSALLRKRVPISADLRRRIIDRDKQTCQYCKRSGSPQRDADGVSWEIDHVVPVTNGGFSTLDNLALACRGCNNSKRAKTLDEFVGELHQKKADA